MGCGGSKEEDSAGAGGRQQASAQQKYAAPPEVPAKAASNPSASVVASPAKAAVAQPPAVQSDNYGANAEDTLMKVRQRLHAAFTTVYASAAPASAFLTRECRRAYIIFYLDLCSQISTLMQKFAEVRNERTTPVQVLRRVLDLVVADCHASFARCGNVACIGGRLRSQAA